MARATKTSSAIPSHGDIKKPLLNLLRTKPEVSLEEAVAYIAKHFRLPEKVQKHMQPCGKETILQNRVRWARWELKKAGKTKTTRRGFFGIA